MSNRKFAPDPITGFLNRGAGLSVARRLVDEAAAGRQPISVLWLDIDRFQNVNASFGHRGGDRVIANVASRLRGVLPDGGVCARMGSDEFLVLLPGWQLVAMRGLAARLAEALELPVPMGGVMLHPTASIGLAGLLPGEHCHRFLERADRAMLDAKRQGGNRLVVSEDSMLADGHSLCLVREELAIEADLHRALDKGWLSLDFQPVLRFDGRLEAVEGLMRCRVDGRSLPSGRFIPVAEKTGLIVRLGEWSLLQGARFAARLRDEGRPTRVAINVSRAQLTSPSFLPALHGALLCAGIDPALLELELTESLVMENTELVQAHLRRIRETGVGLAIDDFGTGYSSLSCLMDLPATKLKLDRSFVQVLPDDPRAFAVVRAMSRLARELGMAMVAEGVETEAQLTALRAADVDAVQGFVWAGPMNEQALLAWLEERPKT
ncbi:putative bifunctional diguanylate cyclase/phosphodiesterase [Zoogloea sp.]|uniref:putative bifunctional diguanylate cyclase/phosphodiesterase n=1 Tax=Zoogloea sp. TaxID=49181 RepID=UPI0026181BC4|nr:EAL domain-containing protein [uncultured Zoogloea sp.]